MPKIDLRAAALNVLSLLANVPALQAQACVSHGGCSGPTSYIIIFIRYRASRPTMHINPTITSPHTHYVPSDPSAAGASFSSFSSSRQASVFDLLPSPAALATRAQGEGSPPHAAAAPSQRRPSSASSLAHRQPVQPPVGAWHRLSI